MTDEEEDESCLARQRNEAAVLKSIYCDQLQLLSETGQPLECVIQLWAEVPTADNIANLPRLDLHVKCSEEYPLVTPFIQLENCKKIANDKVAALKEELLNLADSQKGEVLIHDLANHCENFLFKYDIPKSCSLYEGMMQRNKDLEEMKAKEQQKKLEDERRKREEIISHIQSQKQVMRKALRRRSKSEAVESPEDAAPRERMNSVVDEPTTPVPGNEGDPWEFLKTHSTSRFSSDFECIQKLGEGAYGEVVKARHRMDGGYYAIKKIELNPSDYSTFKIGKITREVKLLSCLNHENVVRYYNSWVEKAAAGEANGGESEDEVDENDTGFKSSKLNVTDMLPQTQMSLDFDDAEEDDGEDSDEFVRFSNGSGSNSDEREDVDSPSSSGESNKTLKPVLYMYIQMELCEKNTLRNAIDDGLYSDNDRVWRLFREIVEGLCHIHHQGIMHRDLKPVNIFLGNNDQVKIGDFGLATTSKTQKPTVGDVVDSFSLTDGSTDSSLRDFSLTNLVGTPLYVAPEVDRNKHNYDKKVDVYSLGIIFFEMNHPPFQTTMEKYNTISSLRKPEIVFPPDFPHNEKSEEYTMIRWMLSHDIKERPSSEEILVHDRLVTVKLDEGDVKDMVKRTLSNPQSKDYKFLIASCFNQDMPAAFVATYNMSTFRSFKFITNLNVVEERLRSIFQRYGAVCFLPPLFTPGPAPKTGVSLMTIIGGLVHAPTDLMMPFARYVMQNPSVTNLKRYAMDKVYREMPVGIHPREVYECRFDIVSSSFGDLMPDLELLAILRDVLKALPQLLRRNCVIYLNHSNLIATLIESCLSNSSIAIKETDIRDMREALIKIMTEYSSKVDLQNNLRSVNLSERAISIINSWMEVEGGAKEILSSLPNLVKDAEALNKCVNAVKQLQRLMSECEVLEMQCPVLIKPSIFCDPSHYTGVLFQVKCDLKVKGKNMDFCTIARGGRYDGLLEEMKQTIPSKEASKPSRCITGFTLDLETLVHMMDDDDRSPIVDVLFCSLKCSPMTTERLTLLKELWNLNLRVYCSNTLQSMEEIMGLCNHLGVQILLLVKSSDPHCVKVKHLGSKVEKKLNFNEVVDYLTKPSFNKQESISLTRQSANVPLIQFMDKTNHGQMRIYEDKIFENLASIMQRFSASVRVEVLVLPVKAELIRFLSSIIEFEDVLKSIEPALKRYSAQKKLILKTAKQIEDTRNTYPNAVMILYSLNDNIYKVLM